MKRLISLFVRDDRGQDLIEYAFLAVLIGLAVVIGLQTLATGLKTGLDNVSTQLGSSK